MLNIFDVVLNYFDVIGRNLFANISCAAYYELVYEFYAMFSFNINPLRIVETRGVVCFWFLSKNFRMLILDFNIAMGFVDPDDVQANSYHTILLDIPSNFDSNVDYSTLTQPRNHLYNPKTFKDLLVHESALRYIHRLLTFSYSCRNDSSSVNQDIIFILVVYVF